MRYLFLDNSSMPPAQKISSWLERSKTQESSVILARTELTAQDVYYFQDNLFQDPAGFEHLLPIRITTAGLDSLSSGESLSASSIMSFGEVSCTESHTLNIIYSPRAIKDQHGQVSLIAPWRWQREWQRYLSVQEAVYAFRERTVTVLVCSAKPAWPDVLSDGRCLGEILRYCHALAPGDVLVVYGLKTGQHLDDLPQRGLEAKQLPSGGLVLYRIGEEPPKVDQGTLTIDSQEYKPLPAGRPGAMILTFNIQNPYTHEFELHGGRRQETLNLMDYSDDARIGAYIAEVSEVQAKYIAKQTKRALSRYSRVVWAIQEASDEFILAMQRHARARSLPLRLFSQPAQRDDCILVFSAQEGVEVVASLDIGLDITRSEPQRSMSHQPPLLTLSMIRQELCIHLAACHLFVPHEDRGKSKRTTVVQDVLRQWHLPLRGEHAACVEAIVVLGDFNLKPYFWSNRYYEDEGFYLEAPHGQEPFTERLWISLHDKHKISSADELEGSSANDHLFVYTRTDEPLSANLKVEDKTKQVRREFRDERFPALEEPLQALSNALLSHTHKRIDTSQLSEWGISDHCPLAVTVVNGPHRAQATKPQRRHGGASRLASPRTHRSSSEAVASGGRSSPDALARREAGARRISRPVGRTEARRSSSGSSSRRPRRPPGSRLSLL